MAHTGITWAKMSYNFQFQSSSPSTEALVVSSQCVHTQYIEHIVHYPDCYSAGVNTMLRMVHPLNNIRSVVVHWRSILQQKGICMDDVSPKKGLGGHVCT